jgi:hypothetical protein
MRVDIVSMTPPPSQKPPFSWLSLLIAAFLVFRGSSRAIDGNFGVWTWLCLGLGLFWVGQEMARWWRFRSLEAAAPKPKAPHSPAGSTDHDPPQSLVFLLDAPRDNTDQAWIRNLGQALGIEFKETGDTNGYLIPMPHPVNEHGGDCHVMSVPEGVFQILTASRPYMENPAESAENLKDRRLREAVTRHQAWVSVDLQCWHDESADPAAPYRLIGKAIAALAGPDVLAVYAPEINRLNVFDPACLPVLAGDTPLSVFDHPSTRQDPTQDT